MLSVVINFLLFNSVSQGLAIKLSFNSFNTFYTDVLNIYEGVGASKILRGKLKQVYNPLSK